MKKILTLLLICASTVALAQGKWTGTWATAQQFTVPADTPKTWLSNASIRQTVHVSLGSGIMHVQLSNAYGSSPLQVKSVYIADALDSCAIDTRTATYLTFNKKRNVTIGPGRDIVSDPVTYNLKPLQRLSITINYGDVPAELTSHAGSRTTSYVIKGVSKPRTSFVNGERLEHWYNISAIDVLDKSEGCVAVLGNSITDGRGSTTDKQNRWTDVMAEELSAKGKLEGVLNLGIGGNCVLRGGLGDPAVKRFHRDILEQSGVRKLIIAEGTNDIGGSNGNSEEVASRLIEAYKGFIKEAHDNGIKVYMATITPFKHSQYHTPFHEAARQTVNDWMRASKGFDGLIDFDKLVSDPADPQAMREELKDDWLHLNVEGYKEMGKYAASIIGDN